MGWVVDFWGTLILSPATLIPSPATLILSPETLIHVPSPETLIPEVEQYGKETVSAVYPINIRLAQAEPTQGSTVLDKVRTPHTIGVQRDFLHNLKVDNP